MKKGFFRPGPAVLSLLWWVASWSAAPGQAIIAGTDPVTDLGAPDGWSNLLYINESNTFDFTSSGQTQGVAFQFRFWADRDSGTLTPFVAEVVEPDGFIIRAIGTTRRGGEDWTEAGLQTFAFKEGEAPVVEQGWAAGFISSTPEGEEGGSPIPFTVSTIEGWLTGTSTTGSGTPSIVVGEAPTPGATGTDANAYGKRQYAFHIAAALTVPLPPTDITATPSVLRAGLAAGATAATLRAVDGNAADTHTFTLVPGAGAADNALFSITGSDLKAAAALGGDGATYSIRVNARDGTGLTFERALAFSVLGDRPPTAVRLAPGSILSLISIGTVVGALATDDPNAGQGDVHAYELVAGDGSGDNGFFSIDADRLVLQVDPEIGRTYRIRIRSTDSAGLFREETFALPVLQVVGNSLAPRVEAATDGAVVPIFYTTGVGMPGPGTVEAVTIPLQSAGQLGLVFRMFQLRPTAEGEAFDVIGDSGEITVAGTVGGLATFVFPNGSMTVQAGDLFYHYGRGIPFDSNQGNIKPIWYPCPIPPVPGEPLNLAPGNGTFPLREDLQRDYAWAVHFTPGSSSTLRIVEVVFNPATKSLTLTWASRPEQRYRIRASAGLASWPEEIEAGIQGAAGATTSRTFGPVAVPGTTFYRVEESP